MNASFTVQELLGGGAIVAGTDTHGATGKTHVETRQWDSIKQKIVDSSNVEQFNAAVENFFKPLTDAAEAVLAASTPEPDELTFVVIDPGQDGTEAKPAEVYTLCEDSIILRILEEGNQADIDRLVWLSEDELVVLDAPAPAPADTWAVAQDEPPF